MDVLEEMSIFETILDYYMSVPGMSWPSYPIFASWMTVAW